MRSHRKGIVIFEWILLITLFVIGIVGGFAIVRDSTVIESAEVADAILHHNHSYHITPGLTATLHEKGKGGEFIGGNWVSSDEEIEICSGFTGGSNYVDFNSSVNAPQVQILATAIDGDE